jgi:hypothetical protein
VPAEKLDTKQGKIHKQYEIFTYIHCSKGVEYISKVFGTRSPDVRKKQEARFE